MRILIKIDQKQLQHEYERPLSPNPSGERSTQHRGCTPLKDERISPTQAMHTHTNSVLYCSTHTVSVQESLDVTSKNPSPKPNFAVKNAESEPYCQSLRGFSPVLRNSFIKIALKIKKSAILLPVFFAYRMPFECNGIFKKANEKQNTGSADALTLCTKLIATPDLPRFSGPRTH